jgi:hypothetical protein
LNHRPRPYQGRALDRRDRSRGQTGRSPFLKLPTSCRVLLPAAKPQTHPKNIEAIANLSDICFEAEISHHSIRRRAVIKSKYSGKWRQNANKS